MLYQVSATCDDEIRPYDKEQKLKIKPEQQKQKKEHATEDVKIKHVMSSVVFTVTQAEFQVTTPHTRIQLLYWSQKLRQLRQVRDQNRAREAAQRLL